jgi:hypothetical protein
VSLFKRLFGDRETEKERETQAQIADAIRAVVSTQLVDLREALEQIAEREERLYGGRRAEPH